MAQISKPISLQDKKRALKEKLANIEKKEKAEAEKRMILVGRAVLDEMEASPDFQQRLSAILDRRITKKRERSMLGLSEKATA